MHIGSRGSGRLLRKRAAPRGGSDTLDHVARRPPVEPFRRFVEQPDWAVAQEQAGEREPARLPGRKADAAFAELFANRWCILTPLDGTDPAALEKLAAFWRACGSNIDTMDPQHHDMVLAMVSHLPHIIAYNIVGTADDLQTVTKSEVIKYSASGFRDFTRLAASDPTMWRDVCLHNKDAILEMLARFSEDLSALQRAIRWGDGDKLFDLFTRTRAVRRSIIEAGQEVDAPDFGRIAAAHPEKQPEKR